MKGYQIQFKWAEKFKPTEDNGEWHTHMKYKRLERALARFPSRNAFVKYRLINNNGELIKEIKEL